MRISDWSSDVCSPDLVQHGLVSSEAFGIGGLALGRFLQQQYVDADIAKDTQEIGEIGRRIFALIDAEVVNAGGVIGKCRTMRFDRPASRRGTRPCQRQTRETRTQTQRSNERRDGKKGVSTCRCRWSPDH